MRATAAETLPASTRSMRWRVTRSRMSCSLHSGVWSRSRTWTLAPSATSRRAMQAPMKPPPPVTKAVLAAMRRPPSGPVVAERREERLGPPADLLRVLGRVLPARRLVGLGSRGADGAPGVHLLELLPVPRRRGQRQIASDPDLVEDL